MPQSCCNVPLETMILSTSPIEHINALTFPMKIYQVCARICKFFAFIKDLNNTPTLHVAKHIFIE